MVDIRLRNNVYFGKDIGKMLFTTEYAFDEGMSNSYTLSQRAGES